MKVTIIGVGNIGGAIARGLAKGSILKASGITCTDLMQENLDKIWQRFYQADPSRQENAGLGLGLSMVQQIVTLHGGTVAVTSAPGHGTTFTVTLPEHHGKEES